MHNPFHVVEKGFFFPTDDSIPMSAVASASGGQISLNVAKDAALHHGWDTVPATETVLTDVGIGSTHRDSVDVGVTARDSVADRLTAATAATVTGDEEMRIPVMHEAGAVRIEKDVITEGWSRVKRRVVDRAATGADVGAFEEMVIEVPLRSEAVDVQKKARVTGEVVVACCPGAMASPATRGHVDTADGPDR